MHWNKISAMKKDKTLGEDDAKRLEKQIDEEVNKLKAEIDQLSKAKEAEIMKFSLAVDETLPVHVE